MSSLKKAQPRDPLAGGTKLTVSGFGLREMIAVVACMSERDFAGAFKDAKPEHPGEKPVSYQFNKFVREYKRDVGRWICYLDLGNLDLLASYLRERLEENGL